MKSVQDKKVKLWGVGFVKEVVFKPGVIDVQGGKSEEEKVMGKRIGGSEMEELEADKEIKGAYHNTYIHTHTYIHVYH